MSNEYQREAHPFVERPDQTDGIDHFLKHMRSDYFSVRDKLTSVFAWAVPNDAALTCMVKHCRERNQKGIVEMGAGTGYWASLLEPLLGPELDIICYDKAHPVSRDNAWHVGVSDTHFTVRDGVPETLRDHADRALFLCWPPYSNPMASDCLDFYGGDTLFFVGEDEYGCTGDGAFFEALRNDWKHQESVSIPQWPGVHDTLGVWTRRGDGS